MITVAKLLLEEKIETTTSDICIDLTAVQCCQHVFVEYLEYFAPDFTLHPDILTKQENANTKQVCKAENISV